MPAEPEFVLLAAEDAVRLAPEGTQPLAKAAVVIEDELEARLGSAVSADPLRQLAAALDRLREPLVLHYLYSLERT